MSTRPLDALVIGPSVNTVETIWVEIYAERELRYAKLMLPVTVAERPFFNPPRKRATPPERF